MTVVVAVNSPLRLVYDESDQSLQFHFSVSPTIEENQSLRVFCIHVRKYVGSHYLDIEWVVQ